MYEENESYIFAVNKIQIQMKKYLLLFLIAPLLLSNPNEEKALLLKKVNTEIIVDGVIDPIWSEADSVNSFFQFAPNYAQPATEQTIAKVLSTDENLYCLFICYETTSDIQAYAGLQDNFTGDIVSFMIDTFNDKQTAYKFAVNASGVRADSRLLDDSRNRDYSWDGIWFSASQIYDWGYVVEMKIPYKSIKYDKELSAWGLDFDRWRADDNEDLYWCEYQQNEGQRISKFGKLIFDGFKPTSTGLNLEVYPVGISKATYLGDNKYDINADAGLDIFYNPSQALTFQLTANPDFAQIEADPFDFNISRYESYFSERRPFFSEGNEIFNPSGRQQNSGFYRPIELFYSRRIGKLLPDGQEVPLILGTKAFGRIDDWEYGGFVALTGEVDYMDGGESLKEQRAIFGSGRIKKSIFDNSSIGVLFVGKQTKDNTYGVIDIDGAFRTSDLQLAYQFARSIKNNDGDYAASLGLTSFGESWATLARVRAVGKDFDIQQIGFVPWAGTMQSVALTGPFWYFETGSIRQIFLYGGTAFNYEDADLFMDYGGVIGFNMDFKQNWGWEINFDFVKTKDENIIYNSYSAYLSSWFRSSAKWNANIFGGMQKTYNFSRGYLGYYSYAGIGGEWKPFNILEIGSSYGMYVELDPDNKVDEITYNARPYFSLTPINNLNFRLYVDNLYLRSSDKLERVVLGFLFSWNFSPKSWIYFAVNELRDRGDEYDVSGNILPARMHTTNRAAVLKVKYLYYF